MGDKRPMDEALLLDAWRSQDPRREDGDRSYGEMIEALRLFLDRVAAAKPDQATLAALAGDLAGWSQSLAACAVDEGRQEFGRCSDLAGDGQTMQPAFCIDRCEPTEIAGSVAFGRYFLGRNSAAHGGAIASLFDEVLGRLVSVGTTTRRRTAALRIDYRSVAPIEQTLEVRGWLVSDEGRKRIVRAELRHGDRLCAEAEGLYVALLPGQP